MRRKLDIEIKAGIFIFLGMILIMVTILLMGGGKSLFESNYRLITVIPDAGGLSKGSYVRSGGLKIGRVEEIEFSEHYDNLKVTLRIDSRFQQRIREDSAVKLQTQGVLGDKYIEITGGSQDKPAAANGSLIQAEAGKDLTAMLADGSNAVQLLKENLANLKIITTAMARNNQMDNIMKDLASTTNNMKEFSAAMKSSSLANELGQTMKNMRLISEKMKNGEGTIGALLTDSSLYEDIKHLIGGANRNNVLKFFVRQAVKSSDDDAVAAEQKKTEAKKEEAKKGKNPASSNKP